MPPGRVRAERRNNSKRGGTDAGKPARLGPDIGWQACGFLTGSDWAWPVVGKNDVHGGTSQDGEHRVAAVLCNPVIDAGGLDGQDDFRDEFEAEAPPYRRRVGPLDAELGILRTCSVELGTGYPLRKSQGLAGQELALPLVFSCRIENVDPVAAGAAASAEMADQRLREFRVACMRIDFAEPVKQPAELGRILGQPSHRPLGKARYHRIVRAPMAACVRRNRTADARSREHRSIAGPAAPFEQPA